MTPIEMLEIEPMAESTSAPVLEIEPAPETSTALAPLATVLGADVALPQLIRFVPDVRLRAAVQEATTYALNVKVDGEEGLKAADVALTALRRTVGAVTEHFAEPTAIANSLHKRLTGIRGEWVEAASTAIKTVGNRIFAEQRRLEAIAAEARRKAQDEADRQAREDARRQAEDAKKNQAPAAVVQEMEQRAETAKAAPVAPVQSATKLAGVTTVTSWKARLANASADTEPNPEIGEMTPVQLACVKTLLSAILEGRAPIAAIEINWPYLNKRAGADKSTLSIPGVEAFEVGSTRAKAARTR